LAVLIVDDFSEIIGLFGCLVFRRVRGAVVDRSFKHRTNNQATQSNATTYNPWTAERTTARKAA
jgi:hypothetical protein